MKTEQILATLGLSKHESLVYTGLLKHGSASVADLTKITGLYRPAIYNTIPKLLNRGLINKMKKGQRTLYLPESPKKLKDEVVSLKLFIDETVQELNNDFLQSNTRPTVTFYEGTKGIKQVHNDLVDSLKRGEVYYRYSSRNNTTELPKYRTTYFAENMKKKQLQRFVIASSERAKEYSKNINRSVKSIPPSFDLFDDNIYQLIYADKVAFIDFNSETATIIKNKKIAEFQKKIFKLLYSKL
jgi:sugar-specific transcriptional regulator TrmB